MDKHVTSLEQSKKLKEIGVEQDDGKEFRAFNLSELIEILGDKFYSVEFVNAQWLARARKESYNVETCLGLDPIEAVYNLIIKVHEEGLLFNQKKDENT